jgi:hypothetical protein
MSATLGSTTAAMHIPPMTCVRARCVLRPPGSSIHPRRGASGMSKVISSQVAAKASV